MRLLFICHQFFPEHVGGTELYTWGLATRALNMGWQVLVASYIESPSGNPQDFGIEWTRYESISLAKIHYNLSLADHPLQAEYANEALVPFFEEIHRSFSPDLVHHTHSMKVSGTALRFFAQKGISNLLTLPDFWYICPRHTLVKWNGKLCSGPRSSYQCAKCLSHTHGFFPGKIASWPPFLVYSYLWAHNHLPVPPAEPAIKRDAMALRARKQFLLDTCQMADRVLVLSAFQQKMLVQNGYPSEKLTLIPHGMETKGLSPKRLPLKKLGPIQLSFIGSIVPHKGLHSFLRSFAEAGNPQLHLTIYGGMSTENAYHQSISQQIDQLERVNWAGTFPFDQMGQVLEKTDVLVMPAEWYENEPLVIKSALYCHVPVMCSDIGSLREMITEGKTGWLIPTGNQQAWARALAKVQWEQLPDFSKSTYQISSMDAYFSELLTIYKQLSHE